MLNFEARTNYTNNGEPHWDALSLLMPHSDPCDPLEGLGILKNQIDEILELPVNEQSKRWIENFFTTGTSIPKVWNLGQRMAIGYQYMGCTKTSNPSLYRSFYKDIVTCVGCSCILDSELPRTVGSDKDVTYLENKNLKYHMCTECRPLTILKITDVPFDSLIKEEPIEARYNDSKDLLKQITRGVYQYDHENFIRFSEILFDGPNPNLEVGK